MDSGGDLKQLPDSARLLGALTAVAVDAPLCIAGPAATIAIGVVSLPIGLTSRKAESP